MKFGDIKVVSCDIGKGQIEWIHERQVVCLGEKLVNMMEPDVEYLVSYKFAESEEFTPGMLSLRATMNVERLDYQERVAYFCSDASLILEPRVGLFQRLKNAWRYIRKGGYQVIREENADE